ncbi:hypothetical protein [Mesonia aquimarina]|uniref:hypothetical protein n=1 Tax=Mesonia aquimarina TaxID=1504967 RepID=UPI000EF5EAE4|nr:hypothetical protein [Mesonia aquimarina]
MVEVYRIPKLYFYVLLFFINIIVAQTSDMVYMLDGKVNEGKVTAIKQNSIKFIYTGEDLEYSFKKEKIHKIEFSSGRIQEINPVEHKTASVSTKNKLAIIPFTMVSNDAALTQKTVAEDIQHSSVISFEKHTTGLTIVDPLKVNALLIKNSITSESIKQFMPNELAEILGVEYVVYGIATINYKGSRSSGSTSSVYKEKDEKSKGKTTGKSYGSNYSSTTEEYNTNIEMTIYNDKGNNVYSVKRNSFGSSLDSYKATLDYLIKRCPWGSKGK